MCGALAFAFSYWSGRKSEAERDAKDALSEQRAESRHVQVLQALGIRAANFVDSLRAKFPYGYVLFGAVPGGDTVYLPFYKGELFVSADWASTKFEPDYANKTIRVKVSQPQWKQDIGATLRINVGTAVSTFPLKKGESMPFQLVRSEGQPMMYFEILDDDQRNPVYVIGFKK